MIEFFQKIILIRFSPELDDTAFRVGGVSLRSLEPENGGFFRADILDDFVHIIIFKIGIIGDIVLLHPGFD